jgi:pyruvate formate lyase activating enzyme
MDELMAEIEKERDVMEDSGGGVTLCGGEPLMQPQAALAVLKELGRRGLHRTVDTSLYASRETVKAIAEETDLFLVDLKHMDSNRHRELTGVPNEPILENARLLMELGANIWFRLPLIEGINDDEENIEATASFLASLNANPSTLNSKPSTLKSIIHLLPYHDVGKDKHRRRGTEYNPEGLLMQAPSDETLDRCRQQFERHGISVVVGG